MTSPAFAVHWISTAADHHRRMNMDEFAAGPAAWA